MTLLFIYVYIKLQFLEYHIPKEDILKDVWVFKYAVKNIEAKLEFAARNNVQTFKTWMVRVPSPTLEK